MIAQRREQVDLGIESQVAGAAQHVDARGRMVGLHLACNRECGVARVVGANEQLEVRIILPREGGEILIETLLGALHRLQHGNGGSVLALPLARRQHHEDRRVRKQGDEQRAGS